jgi:hypothetical protein
MAENKDAKGTVFDLDAKESEGDWFDFFESHIDLDSGEIIYDDPKPGTGKACFRSVVPFLEKCIEARKRKHQFVLNPKTRSMERVEYYEPLFMEEQKKQNEDMYDYAIVGLERFFDAQGNALECTRENKLKLSKVKVFDRYMARCMELQTNSKFERQKASEKN